jgi:hypothetical protein
MQTNEAGTGELRQISGETILKAARYELTITHAKILGGLPSISGVILNPPPHGFPLPLVGSELMLRLEDGREWDCLLADSGGTLTGRGPGLGRAL